MLQLFIRFPELGEFIEFPLWPRKSWSESQKDQRTRMHCSRMHTYRTLQYGGSPWRNPPPPDRDPPPHPVWTESQTGVKTLPFRNNKHQENFRFPFRFGRCEWTLSVHSYHPPAKAREGNVFTGVCHYVGGIPGLMSGEEVGSMGPGIPTHPPDLGYPPQPPATVIWWSSLETCSNLFTWGPTPWPPPATGTDT